MKQNEEEAPESKVRKKTGGLFIVQNEDVTDTEIETIFPDVFTHEDLKETATQFLMAVFVDGGEVFDNEAFDLFIRREAEVRAWPLGECYEACGREATVLHEPIGDLAVPYCVPCALKGK